MSIEVTRRRFLCQAANMSNLDGRVSIVRLVFLIFLAFGISSAQAAEIVHNAEYYILEAQNGEVF
jgi:hypothetical protein